MRVLLVAWLVALAGCTDDAGGNQTVDPGPDPDPEPEPDADPDPGPEPEPDPEPGNDTEPREPVTWEVEVRDNSFSPGTLDVQVGDTVRWVRVGSNHNVVADDGTYDSGACPGLDCFGPPPMRQEYEWTFEEVGESGYHCSVHGSAGSGMAGTVRVLAVYDERP